MKKTTRENKKSFLTLIGIFLVLLAIFLVVYSRYIEKKNLIGTGGSSKVKYNILNSLNIFN